MLNDDDEFEREHPSYGLVHISRVTGGPGAHRLFGSQLPSLLSSGTRDSEETGNDDGGTPARRDARK